MSKSLPVSWHFFLTFSCLVMVPYNADANTYPFLQGGGEMGELVRNFDWSRTLLGLPHQWPKSLQTTLGFMLHLKVPMFLFWGEELRCFYNDAYRSSLGSQGKHPTALGERGELVWPEIWPTIKPLIDQVLAGGEGTWSEDQLIPIYHNGQLEEVYWTFSYSPAYGDTGEIAGVVVTCTETAMAVGRRQQAEETQRQLLASFDESPVAIAIISTDNLTFRMANSFYGHLVGRKPEELVDKPLLEALPELAGQGFDQLLQEVIDTGNPFMAKEVAVDLVRQGQLQTIYVDLTYQPRRQADNPISGILVVATDVTQQVLARQRIEESERRFRSLVEESPVATCLFVGEQFVIEVANEGMIRFFGRGPSIVGQSARSVLTGIGADQAALALLEQVFRSGKRFAAMGAPASLTIDGVVGTYYFDFSLKPLRNAAGDVYAILETALEVTAQVLARRHLEDSEARFRALSAELDLLVQQRTAQLQASVQELKRSNESLQQFAYIASHDLQEPLRKIQSFGDLLKSQYADKLGEGIPLLDRMQSAASRMSTLIKDLLAYSRISTQQRAITPVCLDQLLHTVLSDLEVVLAETGTEVKVETLPTVQGDALQLGQLFQNLLSNALKFRQVNTPSLVWVRSREVAAPDLPASLKLTRAAKAYYCIEVSDNGIGFDPKYVDRIFQVFQRLHGKNQYPGTGIGLAICEKVAANHGGAIIATSQPGHGATFSVYLPAN